MSVQYVDSQPHFAATLVNRLKEEISQINLYSSTSIAICSASAAAVVAWAVLQNPIEAIIVYYLTGAAVFFAANGRSK